MNKRVFDIERPIEVRIYRNVSFVDIPVTEYIEDGVKRYYYHQYRLDYGSVALSKMLQEESEKCKNL